MRLPKKSLEVFVVYACQFAVVSRFCNEDYCLFRVLPCLQETHRTVPAAELGVVDFYFALNAVNSESLALFFNFTCNHEFAASHTCASTNITFFSNKILCRCSCGNQKPPGRPLNFDGSTAQVASYILPTFPSTMIKPPFMPCYCHGKEKQNSHHRHRESQLNRLSFRNRSIRRRCRLQ
jgi:hypothetical protein